MKRKLGLVLILTSIAWVVTSREHSGAGFSPYVDETGNISRPQEFRDNWTHLGTYFVIAKSESGHSMHSVYTEKRNLEVYNETGEWPDGAVLVKEVMHTAGAQLTTGASNWATRPDVWFVVVKDGLERFPDHPLWGDGWGWALFRSDAPNVQVATNYKQDCIPCHMPAKETDFVYVQGYPSVHKRPNVSRNQLDRMANAVGSVDFRAGSPERGAKIFAKTCSFCHAIDNEERKVGPSLAAVATEGRLPSGKPGSPENVLRQINNGGGGMPSFADSLDPQQKADLIAYVRHPR